jgi:hypothetical protein
MGRPMAKKRIVASLALGFLACTLAMLPVTTAHAGCVWRGTAPACGADRSDCEPGEEALELQAAAHQIQTPQGKSTPFGSECIFGGLKVLCCTKAKPAPAPAGPAPADPSEKYSPKTKDWMKYKDKAAPATPGPKGPPTKLPAACANNDVDVYDSPVEPRSVIGMMAAGTKAKVVQRHPDGWWKMLGLGWVAKDHLTSC